MYCTQCGTQNSNQSRFCTGCGRSLGVNVSTQPAHNVPRRRFNKAIKWTGIVSGSIVVTFVLLLVIGILIGEDAHDQQLVDPSGTQPTAPSNPVLTVPSPTTPPHDDPKSTAGTSSPATHIPTPTLEPPPPPTSTPHPTATPLPTPIPVTSDRLVTDKEANEVAWEKKYLGNYAIITGEITIIQDARNYYDVKLMGDSLSSVVCKVSKSPEHEAKVLRLVKGDHITVLGKITDDGIFDLVVQQCTIQVESNRNR